MSDREKEFMNAMKGLSANAVAVGLRSFIGTINYVGMGKRYMAKEWADPDSCSTGQYAEMKKMKTIALEELRAAAERAHANRRIRR